MATGAASSQYVIDVAATFSGDQTIAQLDKLTANLQGGGKGAAYFQQAISEVSTALEAAKGATLAANTALAKGTEEYRELEKAADKAAKAAEQAALKGKLSPEMSRTADQAAQSLAAYSAKLKVLETDAAAATKKQDGLATSLKNINTLSSHVDDTLNKQAEASSKARGALSAIGGPLGKIGSAIVAPVDGFNKLSQTMGASNAAAIVAAAGIAAVAVAIVAVTAAVIIGAGAVASWSIGLSDQARSASLATEAFEAMNPAVEAVSGTIDELTDVTGLSEAALDGIAKKLVDAKVKAADLPEALRAAALEERALGNGGADQFIADMKASKMSVSALADATQKKLGGVVAQQLRGLDGQAATFKTNIGRLFGDLNIEPVLSGLERLGALFDEQTAAGQTIKFLFGSVFQPLIDQADNAAIVVEAFALGFLIGLTKTYIATKPVIKAIESVFGFHDTSLQSVVDGVTKAAEYLAPVFVVITVAFGAVVAAIVIAIGVITAIQVAIFALPFAIAAAALALGNVFLNAWHSVTTFLSSIDLATVGSNIIAGLANGLLAAGPAVLHAITGVVGGAIDSAKHLLGIASPSKVFGEIGVNTGEGFAGGVEDTTDAAQSSLAAMVAPPESPLSKQDALSGNFGGSAPAAPAPQAQTQGSSSSKPPIDFTGANFNFYGVKDAEDSLDRFEELLTLVFERDRAQLGAAAAA